MIDIGYLFILLGESPEPRRSLKLIHDAELSQEQLGNNGGTMVRTGVTGAPRAVHR